MLTKITSTKVHQLFQHILFSSIACKCITENVRLCNVSKFALINSRQLFSQKNSYIIQNYLKIECVNSAYSYDMSHGISYQIKYQTMEQMGDRITPINTHTLQCFLTIYKICQFITIYQFIRIYNLITYDTTMEISHV